ncbi:hypothetical protein JRO89_XS03G0068300 [Xanthoceras sorbifolium]|uniref:S-protein homolog n=1 Tax=Xanthoceras sorbifolium TaxID=99658 RepID=A0ABQ8I8X7_9ROSI|nr:hypothetical protein JRO89_XS03G0068300 [Xanthoceras sorbifolium]
MSPFKTYAVLFILALATSISPVVLSFEVFIFNILGTDATLTVHCKSTDQDLGTHVLEREAHFNWDFKIGKGSPAIYDCDLSYDKITGHFTMFNEQRDALRCGDEKCLWKVQQDGMFLYIKEHDAYEKQFSWP